MKKEFLDFMYLEKAIVRSEINALLETENYDQHQCCKDMANINTVSIEIKVKKDQAKVIDLIIAAYIETH